jgi:hypothetical protein
MATSPQHGRFGKPPAPKEVPLLGTETIAQFVLASLQFNADRDRPHCCFDFHGSNVSKWPTAAFIDGSRRVPQSRTPLDAKRFSRLRPKGNAALLSACVSEKTSRPGWNMLVYASGPSCLVSQSATSLTPMIRLKISCAFPVSVVENGGVLKGIYLRRLSRRTS